MATQEVTGLPFPGFINAAATALRDMKPAHADERHFYIQPEQHVYDFLCAGIATVAMGWWGRRCYMRYPRDVDRLHRIDHGSSAMDRCIALILILNLLMNVVYKCSRMDGTWVYMLQPCHIKTAMFVYALVTRNCARGTFAFNVALHIGFFTWMAIFVPDTSNLSQPGEVLNFWVQHILLGVLPLYMLRRGRYPVLDVVYQGKALFFVSNAIGMTLFFFVQLPASLVTGINVNYQLWPPPNQSLFLRPFFKLKLCILIEVLGYMYGYVFPLMVANDPVSKLLRTEAREAKQKAKEIEAKFDPRTDPKMDLSFENVAKAKKENSRVFRVYCDGIFDIFHLGHMRMLEQAKKALGAERTQLIAGCCSDELTWQNKGRTVMDERTRYDSLKHCKWVDEVIEDAPWVITEAFLEEHRIDFVAHDALPYADASGQSGESTDVYAMIKAKGKFLVTERTEGISTSDVILSIVRDYDLFVDRNLRRGYSLDELNVGRTWVYRSLAHEKEKEMKELRGRSTQKINELKESFRVFVQQFDVRRRGEQPFIRDFPHHSADVARDFVALFATAASYLTLILSYLNPFNYLKAKQEKQKAF